MWRASWGLRFWTSTSQVSKVETKASTASIRCTKSEVQMKNEHAQDKYCTTLSSRASQQASKAGHAKPQGERAASSEKGWMFGKWTPTSTPTPDVRQCSRITSGLYCTYPSSVLSAVRKYIPSCSLGTEQGTVPQEHRTRVTNRLKKIGLCRWSCLQHLSVRQLGIIPPCITNIVANE